MRISLLYVSDKPSRWIDEAANNYIKRIPSQFKFTSIRISPVKRGKSSDIDAVREEEWARIEAKLNPHAIKVLLDERGDQYSSRALASKFKHWQDTACDVDFIIAGPDGVSDEQREQAGLLLGLSKLTFPHELARVVLLEQIYRSWTILNNHPYHRD